MSKTVSKFAFTAGLVLAVAFTFSCSGDEGSGSSSSGGGGNGNSITYGNDTYPIVAIGTQTWLAKNLNYAATGSKCYGEGSPVLIDDDDEDNPITKILSNAEVQDNCDKYGRLYDWSTAMSLPSSCNENSCSSQIQPKHRGICPSGWHIPSYDDWGILVDYAGGWDIAGAKLKAGSGWNGNGTDQYEFSALPGGFGISEGFLAVGDFGFWWSASEYEGEYDDIGDIAGSLRMDNSYEDTDWDIRSKSTLRSVRCVKD